MPGLRTECFASQSIWYHRGVTSPCTHLTVTLTLTSSWMKYTVPFPPPVHISCSSAPTSTSLSRLVFFCSPIRAKSRIVLEGHSCSASNSCLGIYSRQWEIHFLCISLPMTSFSAPMGVCWVSVVLALSNPKPIAPDACMQHGWALGHDSRA